MHWSETEPVLHILRPPTACIISCTDTFPCHVKWLSRTLTLCIPQSLLLQIFLFVTACSGDSLFIVSNILWLVSFGLVVVSCLCVSDWFKTIWFFILIVLGIFSVQQKNNIIQEILAFNSKRTSLNYFCLSTN